MRPPGLARAGHCGHFYRKVTKSSENCALGIREDSPLWIFPGTSPALGEPQPHTVTTANWRFISTETLAGDDRAPCLQEHLMVTACRGRIRSSSQRSRATGSLGALGEAVCPAPCDPAAGPGSGSRGGVGFPTAGPTPGWKPSPFAKAVLAKGISGWVNRPAAERAAANLVLASHQLKCFLFLEGIGKP